MKKDCTICAVKTKALISFREADLPLCFRPSILLVFLCSGSLDVTQRTEFVCLLSKINIINTLKVKSDKLFAMD